MSAGRIILRHLCFTGPGKETAVVDFGPGLNVISGASNTGKSFILLSINYMLGGKDKLPNIREALGYDRAILGVAASDDSTFTLFRSTEGGGFQVADGLHTQLPTGVDLKVLSAQHSATNLNTISGYLLGRIGLTGRRVRFNKKNKTNSLSFRNIAHLCVVDEGSIHKTGSPIEGKTPINNTTELAAFKLLLTGVDDSALVAVEADPGITRSVASKLDFVDELLESYRRRLEDENCSEDDLRDQLSRLEATIASEHQALLVSETQYQALVERRAGIRKQLEGGADRRAEIVELHARFALLDAHYRSDLNRLDGIKEVGALVSALSPTQCPLCGARNEHQQTDGECDGNVDAVVAAASAEGAKIKRLRAELAETVDQLGHEAQIFDRLLPRLRDELRTLDGEIQGKSPNLAQIRSNYTELVYASGRIQIELSLRSQIADLVVRRETLAATIDRKQQTDLSTTELPMISLDLFAQQVEAILKAWHFPESERIHFDTATRDLVIAGNTRGSFGKGMRAVTHAAFKIGLLEFCTDRDLPHPGFVVLDSPLLAYRKPNESDDVEPGSVGDLRTTDVQQQFYRYLADWTYGQAIVIENVDPPAEIRARESTTIFHKNAALGRYGFFPAI